MQNQGIVLSDEELDAFFRIADTDLDGRVSFLDF